MNRWLGFVLGITAAFAAGCGDDDDVTVDGGDAALADRVMIDAPPPDMGIDAAPVCGNGMLEGNEQCDTGALNGMNACSASCQSVEVTINTTTAGEQGAGPDARTAGLDVAAMASSWVVAWTDGTGATSDVRTRIFSRNGSPRSNGIDGSRNDFVANMRAGEQLGPRITAKNTTGDDYAVAWVERGATGSARIREFGGDGTPSDITDGEADVGGTDVTAVTGLANIGATYVVGWREAANELRARRVMPSVRPLMPLGIPVLFSMGTSAGAQLSLLPGAQFTTAQGLRDSLWIVVDRGAGDVLARRKYDLMAAFAASPATGLLPLTALGASKPFAHVEVVTATGQRGLVVGEGPVPGTDALATRRFVDEDGSGTMAQLGDRALAPAAAGGRGGFVVVWIEKATAVGARDQLRLDTFTLDGNFIPQPRFGGASGPLLVTSRATPAGASDLGVATPRVSVASDGSVLVVWRDFAARTGAGTAADTGAELRARLFPRLIP